MSWLQDLLGVGRRVLTELAGDSAGPEYTSVDYRAMELTWCKISDIMSGADCIRAARTKYLPKYEEESKTEYDRRLQSAPWRPRIC